ncbi:MAG: PHP domain-containing protein [Candidatus Omnitrophota bacterium]
MNGTGKTADLHVHTHFSDGTFSPREVVEHAASVGLSAVAICDHDILDGIPGAIEAAASRGVEIVPGVELTAEKSGIEIHMLGFFVDWTDNRFKERLRSICDHRITRISEMAGKLNKLGFDITAQEVIEFGGPGSVGRLHLARVLHKKKYVATVDEAFRKYIGHGKSCYVTKINLSPEEAIGMILKAKGVPVLAHPGIIRHDEFIPSYIEAGLRGIEVYHTDHPDARVRHYEALARVNNLLMTGGSDCHGLGKGRVLMGSVRVPYEFVEALQHERG